jgi:hypothetical protein
MKASFLSVCGLVLGSLLFVPVSCTSGFVVGTIAAIKLDARQISKGDKPHPHFYVIASMPKKNGALKALHLSEIDPSYYPYCDGTDASSIEDWKREIRGKYCFLLPDSGGEFRQDECMRVTYGVTTLSPGKQLVEVHWNGDDYLGISKYIAEENRVEPLYSENFPGETFVLAILFSAASALIVRHVGKRLRKKYRPKNGDNTLRL